MCLAHAATHSTTPKAPWRHVLNGYPQRLINTRGAPQRLRIHTQPHVCCAPFGLVGTAHRTGPQPCTVATAYVRARATEPPHNTSTPHTHQRHRKRTNGTCGCAPSPPAGRRASGPGRSPTGPRLRARSGFHVHPVDGRGGGVCLVQRVRTGKFGAVSPCPACGVQPEMVGPLAGTRRGFSTWWGVRPPASPCSAT